MNKFGQMFTIHPCTLTIKEDKLCCIDCALNLIVMLSMADFSIIQTICIPEYINIDENNQVMVRIYNEKIILIPNNESTLYEWDAIGWKSYELYDEAKKGTMLFSQAIIVDDVIYLFPYTEKKLVKFDLKKKTSELSEKLLFEIENNCHSHIASINAPSCIDKITAAGGNSVDDSVYLYNLNDQSVRFMHVNKSGCIISSVAYIGNSLVVWDKTNWSLYKINSEKSSIDKELYVGKSAVRIVELTSKFAILVKLDTNSFWVVDENLNVVYKDEDSVTQCGDRLGIDGIVIYGSKEGFFFRRTDRVLFKIDEYGNVDTIFSMQHIQISPGNSNARLAQKIIRENVSYNIQDFLELVFAYDEDG